MSAAGYCETADCIAMTNSASRPLAQLNIVKRPLWKGTYCEFFVHLNEETNFKMRIVLPDIYRTIRFSNLFGLYPVDETQYPLFMNIMISNLVDCQ